MITVGIIAEFNPFHKGHAYLFEQARRLTGADRLVVVMSGDYVERGAPAVLDKYTRTRMALAAGADAVVEMPVVFSTASAGDYARAGVEILHRIGFVDYLCFGSESGDIDVLLEAARILSAESDDFKNVLCASLKKGLSYPAARQQALCACCDNRDVLEAVSSPNNILAIEYLIALKELESPIVPITVKRIGSAYHETDLTSEYSSATAIRSTLQREMTAEEYAAGYASCVPEGVLEDMRRERITVCPVDEDDLSQALYMKLLLEERETLMTYADVTREMADACNKHRGEPKSFSETVMMLKNKSVTYTSLSRAMLHVVLGIRRPTQETRRIKYVRLLGFNSASSDVCRLMSDNLQGDFVTKPGDYDRSDISFMTDVAAADAYSMLIYQKYGKRPLEELKRGPVIVHL